MCNLRLCLFWLMLALAVALGCRKGPKLPTSADLPPKISNSDPWFEVADHTGIDFHHNSGHQEPKYYLPEIMGGGVGLLDYDRDGLLDVYLVQSGHLDLSDQQPATNRLYRNLGGGKFVDVTDQAGVGDTGYGMGCACGDFDRDGDTDIYVTNMGPNVLYQNNGNGAFGNITSQAGTGDSQWSTSASFLDYDQDGHLDLFVTNYVRWSKASEKRCVLASRPSYCFPKNYSPTPDTLYHNRGDGTFENVSGQVGLLSSFGNGLGVASGDFNADGLVDIYVANDATMNQLWVNNGNGTFADRALISGCAVNVEGITEAGMGVQAVDIENDGDLDLFMTHLNRETNTLYVNNHGDFEDATSQKGLGGPSVSFTGFGVGFADFDHDGYLDVYIANGRVVRGQPLYDSADPYAEPNQLFAGASDGIFTEVIPQGGTDPAQIGTSRCAAFGDLDNDGDIDVVVVDRDRPATLLRNVVGSKGNWIQFRVIDAAGVTAIGARVKLTLANGIQWRVVQRSYGYCASNGPRIHYGLAEQSEVESATVHWPDGQEEKFGPFTSNKQYELHQGTSN